MKEFITFTVKQFGQDSTVTAHYSQIYKMDKQFFWQGFPITTDKSVIKSKIEHETDRTASYEHKV